MYVDFDDISISNSFAQILRVDKNFDLLIVLKQIY